MKSTEINRKIAFWAGTIKSGRQGHIPSINMRTPYDIIPDYYHTNAAFDLLDVLVERGWDICFDSCPNGWHMQLCKDYTIHYEGGGKSKSAAICEAIIALIDKENGLN